ncbi:MAG TPA: ABC transporter ATP-binding protein [Clostridiales bacterium]|mgnify:CR=1 FL=1|nr:ABC transporter ATP-binding protein [Clostridiales bacterium]
MENKEKAPRLLDHVKWTYQGLRILMRLSPSYIPTVLGQSFITAFTPMMQLFFSARILNELSGEREVTAIVLYIVSTVLLSFALSSLKSLLTREVDLSTFWLAYADMLGMESEHFAKMDFPYTENSEISESLAVMDTKALGNGLGLINLYQLSQSVSANLLSLIFAGVLLTGMFQSNSVYESTFVTTHYAVLLLVLLIAVMFLLNACFRRKEKKMLDDLFIENAKSNTAATYYSEYLKADKAAKDIRLYHQGDMLEHVFSYSFNIKSWLRFFFFEGRLGGFLGAGMAVVGGAVYLLIGLRAIAGMYPVGNVVQYVGAVTALVTALTVLFNDFGRAYNNAIYIKPLLDFLNLPDCLSKGSKLLPDETKYVFEFRNVSFRYPGTRTDALKNLNMTMHTNKRLAVVGPNGSGKTTMIKLLCRLYDPTEGEILLNGVNIQEYDIQEYHRLFSVVFQDFKLFPLTIGSNVAVSDTRDQNKAVHYLKEAGFGERLEKFPSGLDTILYKDFDKEGVQISGGEAQKIALARALYKDAAIIVLDEPTAALDPIAEFEVYSAFDKTIGSKTAVFISHRLSSCRFCHDIAVFNNGELVQRGNHDALLAESTGLYASLWHAQAQHYVDT